MIITDDLEKKIEKQERDFQALAIQIERLDEQVNEFMQELGLTFEQLAAFLKDQNNFIEADWQTLHRQRQELEAKLQKELANIRNPLKAKKTYSKRAVPQHWLFVR